MNDIKASTDNLNNKLSKDVLTNKERTFRPLVYICSPYAGDVAKNVKRAIEFSRFAVDKGQIPIAPHLLFPQFMSEDNERELILFMDLILMGKCQEVWVLGDTITEGMSLEIEKARKRRQTVRYFNDDFVEVINHA